MIRELTDLVILSAAHPNYYFTPADPTTSMVYIMHTGCGQVSIANSSSLNQVLADILRHEKTHVLSHIKDQTP